MTRHLVQMNNLRMLRTSKEFLIFDNDASGAFRHVKMHTQVASAYTCSVDQTLCTHISSVFGANVITYDWDEFSQSCCKLAEHLQSSRDLSTIVHKHSAMTNAPHLMVQAAADSINKAVNSNGNRGPTKNAMFVDDNLLANIWVRLKSSLACSIESLHMLFGNPESHFCQSPLYMDK